jgi:propanol-preferring alcohol dehydrogenase
MRAARIERFGAPLRISEIEVPTLGPEDVLVRVRSCGLCGTDLKILAGQFSHISLPLIPGHEIAGEIQKVGSQVVNIREGDRVVVYTYLTCGKCRYCQSGRESLCENLRGNIGITVNGGMAEFVKVPAANVLSISSSISFPQASTLPDAVATVYHALNKRGALKKGELLVVVGVGGLGLHAVQIAKVLGARVLAVDVDDRRLEKAAELGADAVFRSDKDPITPAIQRESNGRGADVVVELVGKRETLEKDLEWLCPGGRLLIVGYDLTQPFSVYSNLVMRKELEILGSRAMTRKDLADVIEWVKEKKIVPVFEEVVPLADVNDAYDRLRRGEVIGRLVLEP